jgi:hypothetical protein
MVSNFYFSPYSLGLGRRGLFYFPELSMQSNLLERRVYTPKLSVEASDAIRRLAWSMEKPMTVAVIKLIMALPAIIDPSKICLACKDKTYCKGCIFSRHLTAEDKKAILEAL